MKSHPIHPALVHFPISCWVIATLLDLLAWISNHSTLWQLAELSMLAGILLAIPAMLFGLLDFSKLPGNKQIIKTANKHMILVCSSWLCYLISLLYHYRSEFIIAVLLSVMGCIILIIGAWHGAELVYKHAVGVNKHPIMK